MRRTRVLGTLLALILLTCGAVIYLDQRGTSGTAPASGGTAQPAAPAGTTAPTAADPDYGELR